MVKKQIRKCGECNLEYRAYKRSCYNALCKVSKPYKENKKKLKRQLAKEAKEEKKIIKDMINDLIKKIKIQKKNGRQSIKSAPHWCFRQRAKREHQKRVGHLDESSSQPRIDGARN